MKKTLILTAALLAGAAHAAEHEIKMLDIGSDKATMVFEPAVLKIAPGDTVTFIPTNKGHNVESKVVPEGAEAFKSELDEKYSVKLDKEGVYIYVCPPHSMMNMAGVIQVGEATNMEAVQKALPKLERRAMSNKGRLTKYSRPPKVSDKARRRRQYAVVRRGDATQYETFGGWLYVEELTNAPAADAANAAEEKAAEKSEQPAAK